MSFHQQIKNHIKEATRARDSVRLGVLRGLLAGFVNGLVAKGQKPEEEQTDDGAIAVVKRQIKQRQDSIEQFRRGGREDLARAEEAELKILKTYLPVQLSREEIRKVAEAKKAELGITDRAKIGLLVGLVMKELKGRADGVDVKAVVESLFSPGANADY